MSTTNISRKKRIRNMFYIILTICTLLIIRIGYLQLVEGSELQSMAYARQTLNRKINPKRGTIFDCSGKIAFAVSASTETISVNPTNIPKEQKEKCARVISDIFSLDYEEVLKKVSKNSSIETIVKKVDKDLTDKLRVWMEENDITEGINIDEDTKRYYPYSTLASNIIGFTGSDNQGLEGLESAYDDILKGTPGKILKLRSATGGSLQNEGEDYVAAIDGDDIILTIDMTIQSIAEKYLMQMCIDNVCTDGGNIIIMNPKNGDILAMANYPNYDLNNPYTINDENLKAVWQELSSKEKTENLQKMWRNKAISDTYEPGSTFKLLTASAALEEGITDTDRSGEFCCSGSINIAGTKIRCWRYYRPHGSQSLREALMNSCNPVFIGLGQKIGVDKYYEYLEKFGLLKKTGIDLPGEAGSIFLKKEKIGPVELATISFGQRFEITPIQMIKLVGTIANNGKEVNPRIVKATVDGKTKEVKEILIEEGEQVISEENAKKVLSMMESVVEEGTGKNAQVAGYAIGGKTGTSEDGVNTGKYVTSFVAVADINDPEIVMIVILYNPTGVGGHQGGVVAAPLAGEVLAEVLPYLEIKKQEEEKEYVSVPEVTGLSVKEAKKILKESNLQTILEEDLADDSIVKDQIPKKGIQVEKETKVILY
ncbi:MAG: penicillin-binding transpeptidase domain-containing protein [Clostridia bacterium]